MLRKILGFCSIVLVIYVQSLFSQPNGIELSIAHNGVGDNISVDYNLNAVKQSFLFGLKYHLNITPYDNGNILGNAQAFNLIEHFGLNLSYTHKLLEINDKIKLSVFYHNQLSFLGINNFGYVPVRGSYYDSLLNRTVGVFTYLPVYLKPGLVIEQNIGSEANIQITNRLYFKESFGTGLMIIINKDYLNINNVGAPNYEFIVPFLRIGVEYTFKKKH